MASFVSEFARFEQAQDKWLGDSKCVDGLLRRFAYQVLNSKHESADDFAHAMDTKARALAKIFLGFDRHYQGTTWNSPGQIDVYLAKACGVDSPKPEERVAGALLRMGHELMELADSMRETNILPEQWQFQADAILQTYTYHMMGLPQGGWSKDVALEKRVNIRERTIVDERLGPVNRLKSYFKKAAGPCKPGQTAEQTGCTPASGKPGGGHPAVDPSKLPKPPKLLTSNQQWQAQNQAAMKEMLELAKDGDLEGLKKFKTPPSPKVEQYRDQLVHAVVTVLKKKPESNPQAVKPEPKPGVAVKLGRASADVLAAINSSTPSELPKGWTYDPKKLSASTLAMNDPISGNIIVGDKFFKIPKGDDRASLVYHEFGHDLNPFDKENSKSTIEALKPFRIGKGPVSVYSQYNHPGSLSHLPEEIVSDVYSSLMMAEYYQNKAGKKSEWTNEEPDGKYGKLELHVLGLAQKAGALVPDWFNKSTSKPVSSPKEIGALADSLSKELGHSKEDLAKHLNGPAGTKDHAASDMRMRIGSSVFSKGTAVPDAALSLQHSKEAVASFVDNMAKGNKATAVKEYSDTPLWDLQVLGGIEVASSAVHGRAYCTYADRKVVMGTTSMSGDYRHELGHAIRFSMGGSKGPHNKTDLTNAVLSEFNKVQERLKKDPLPKTPLSHEEYEQRYGVVGRRCLDSWEENFAEHYRVYHKYLYQDKYEGGGGQKLAGYKKRHPGWAKIWDAWYTAALVAQHLGGSKA